MSEVQRSNVQFPGGLAVRLRWGGSGSAQDVFASSESSGELTDHGPLVSDRPDRLCRAELRVEGPVGAWTARFASVVFDEPRGLLWDTEGLLLVAYGFVVYALVGRSGELRWWHDSGTPVVAVLGSPRLEHVIVQNELETVALDAVGQPVWRVAQSEVVIAAELVGGRLVIRSYAGLASALDPQTGHVTQA